MSQDEVVTERECQNHLFENPPGPGLCLDCGETFEYMWDADLVICSGSSAGKARDL